VRSRLLFPFFSASEGRLRAGLRSGVAQLAAFGLALGATGLAWYVPLPWGGTLARPIDADPRVEDAVSFAVLMILRTSAILAVLWLASRFVDRRPLRDLGLRIDRRFVAEAADTIPAPAVAS